METCTQHDRMEQIALKHTEFVGKANQQMDDMCELIRKNEGTLCILKQDVNELKVIAKENRADIDKLLRLTNGNGSIPKILNEQKEEKPPRKFTDSLNKAWETIQNNIALVLLIIGIWAFLKVVFFKESIKIFGWVIG